MFAAVDGLRALGFRGFNETMPHKEAILPLLDELDGATKISGYVNTVVVEEGRLRGTNTDGSGFVEACEESGVGFAGARVLLAASVLGEGAGGLRILNRSPWRAERLRAKLQGAYQDAHITVHALGEPVGTATGADVIVNATYLGMKDDGPLPIPAPYLEASLAVCDAVYRPGGETALIRLAQERGMRAVSGERMLLYQRIQAQRFWTGKDPDVRAMRDALGGARTTRVDKQA